MEIVLIGLNHRTRAGRAARARLLHAGRGAAGGRAVALARRAIGNAGALHLQSQRAVRCASGIGRGQRRGHGAVSGDLSPSRARRRWAEACTGGTTARRCGTCFAWRRASIRCCWAKRKFWGRCAKRIGSPLDHGRDRAGAQSHVSGRAGSGQARSLGDGDRQAAGFGGVCGSETGRANFRQLARAFGADPGSGRHGRTGGGPSARSRHCAAAGGQSLRASARRNWRRAWARKWSMGSASSGAGMAGHDRLLGGQSRAGAFARDDRTRHGRARSNRSLLLIDLGVPRNVAAGVGASLQRLSLRPGRSVRDRRAKQARAGRRKFRASKPSSKSTSRNSRPGRPAWRPALVLGELRSAARGWSERLSCASGWHRCRIFPPKTGSAWPTLMDEMLDRVLLRAGGALEGRARSAPETAEPRSAARSVPAQPGKTLRHAAHRHARERAGSLAGGERSRATRRGRRGGRTGVDSHHRRSRQRDSAPHLGDGREGRLHQGARRRAAGRPRGSSI